MAFSQSSGIRYSRPLVRCFANGPITALQWNMLSDTAFVSVASFTLRLPSRDFTCPTLATTSNVMGVFWTSGLDKEIQELIEAVVLPMTHKHMFDNIGIRPPKGILLHGPPGTGKTLLGRACAKQTDAIFLKLAGPQLVQVK